MRELTYTELHALHGAVTLALAEVRPVTRAEQKMRVIASIARVEPLMLRTVDEDIDAVTTYLELLELLEKEVFARPEAQPQPSPQQH